MQTRKHEAHLQSKRKGIASTDAHACAYAFTLHVELCISAQVLGAHRQWRTRACVHKGMHNGQAP
eukprot:5130933-Alexandrium_andersonii.AAC.1